MSDDPLEGIDWSVPPSSRVTARIRAEIADDIRPQKALSAGVRVALSLTLSAATAAGVILVMRGAHDVAGPLAAAALGVVGWALVQVTILVLGLAQRPHLGLSKPLRLGMAVLVPLAFFAVLAFGANTWLPFAEVASAEHASGVVVCGIHALLCGVIAAVGMFLIWRRTDPFGPGLSGALVGVTAGLAGAVAVGVACPSTEAWHLWLGHGLVIAALALLGWVVGPRVLSP